MDGSLIAFALVLALAFANGTNDVSKAIATLVGSGVTSYRTAILWGTAWTVAGACLATVIAGAMVRTFSNGLLRASAEVSPSLTPAVLVGTIAWVLFASWRGLPVSTTHAITGAILGAGVTAYGTSGLLWTTFSWKIALPLLVSPLLALTMSVTLHPAVRTVTNRWKGACLCVMPAQRALVTVAPDGSTQTLFQITGFGYPVADVPVRCERAGLTGLTVGLDTIHWVSSGLTSLARGANDTPKIVAILLLGSWLAPGTPGSAQAAPFVAAALAMGAGSLLGGRRVTQVLAEKVTRMDHTEGLSANLTTSTLVLTSAALGLPVSTTHVSSSAIVGIGMLKGVHAVCWDTVRDIVLAWLVTVPAAAGLAACTYLVLTG